ncbi:MAG: hypothetical protein WBC76_10115 [Actinomycetes bacterium]
MKITMMLADAAQQVGGKLYILGGGWSTTGSPTPPMAVVIKIEVPWDRTNVGHDWRLALVDADGRAVQTSDERAVEVTGELEVGRPAGLPDGTPLDAPLVVSFGPMPLESGRYEWRLEIEEFVESCAFLVRS